MLGNDKLLLAIGGVALFVITAATFWKDYDAEWKEYQTEFLELANERLEPKMVEGIQTGIQQIWNKDLGVIDRCTTCHMGINVPGFEDAPNPFKTHPELGFWNDTHAFKDYGCTSCHGGQGFAIKTDDAHGKMKHWEYPMFTKEMADKYGFESTAGIMEINCNTCHRRDTPDMDRMPYSNEGKKLVQQRACVACHVMDGKNGGSIGPELTYEGSQHAEHFDMSGVEGEHHSVFEWHMQHFKNPQKISKGSTMPPVAFDDHQARALSVLVMSWQKKTIPVKFLPNPSRIKSVSAEANAESAGDGDEE